MSNTSVDRYRELARRATTYMQNLADAVNAIAETVARLEVLALAAGEVIDNDEHVVEILAGGTWHLTHGIPCRARPNACRISHALAAADDRLTWPRGRHIASLVDGAIALGPVVPNDYDPVVTHFRNFIRSFERPTP